MSKRPNTPASVETYVSTNVFKKDCTLTDVFSISGLFPASEETGVDNYLTRQHLLRETRRELAEFMDNVPAVHQLFTKHCASNTPSAAVHTKLKKRILPWTAYNNVEPRKSASEETIDCADSVTSLADLNINKRTTIDRSLVLQRCKLLQVDKDDLKKDLRDKMKAYTAPPTTYDINKMKETIDNLYSLEMELPFMKFLKQRYRAQRLARSQAISQAREPEKKPEKKPKTKPTSYLHIKKPQTFPRLKKEQVKEKPVEKGPLLEPYIMGFFLGKSRTYPTVVVRDIPKITIMKVRA